MYKRQEPRPAFDFADGADSIAISGHKSFGSPMPCGVVVVKKSNRDRIARSVAVSYTHLDVYKRQYI